MYIKLFEQLGLGFTFTIIGHSGLCTSLTRQLVNKTISLSQVEIWWWCGCWCSRTRAASHPLLFMMGQGCCLKKILVVAADQTKKAVLVGEKMQWQLWQEIFPVQFCNNQISNFYISPILVAPPKLHTFALKKVVFSVAHHSVILVGNPHK